VNLNPERALSYVIAIAIGLVLSPIMGFIGGIVWYEAGGSPPGDTFADCVGFASFALTVWKLPRLIGKGLEIIRSDMPEPIFSCIEFGTAAALFAGCAMVTVVFLLGHMRPEGWDFMILPVMLLAFGMFALIGRRVGQKRRSKIQ